MAAISRTLLVDDTTNFLNQARLRRRAVTDKVLVAGNGQEALDSLRTHCEQAPLPTCPALILLDMKMPRMNGMEFLQAYAQRPLTSQAAVVIIMLTTSLHPQNVARMRTLPIAGLVSKPLTKEKVNTILKLHFQHQFPLI